MRFALAVFVVAACNTSPSPPPVSPPSSSPTPSPPRPQPTTAPIEPADISTYHVDPATGFRVTFERGDSTAAEVKSHDGEAAGRYDVWRWDPTWPNDVDGFAAKLKEQNFLDDYYRYDVTKTSATDDTWEFRGTSIHTSGQTEPSFVVVRTINGKRFLCKGIHVDTEAAMNAAIASCRSAKLSR